MDNLALLCNLYAEGPATLARLREAQCASLESLETMQAEDLAEILEISLASSRRFLREAQNLVQRVGLAAEGAPAQAARIPSPARDEGIIERVLGAWRAKDALEPEGSEAGASMTATIAREPGTPLRPQLLDGLDMDWCVRLHTCGIDSLEELALSESMELAAVLDVGLTRLMRLQFLARRELEQLRRKAAANGLVWPVAPVASASPSSPAPAAAPEPVSEPQPLRFSPAEAPPPAARALLPRELHSAVAPVEPAAGGPFA